MYTNKGPYNKLYFISIRDHSLTYPCYNMDILILLLTMRKSGKRTGYKGESIPPKGEVV